MDDCNVLSLDRYNGLNGDSLVELTILTSSLRSGFDRQELGPSYMFTVPLKHNETIGPNRISKTNLTHPSVGSVDIQSLEESTKNTR